MTDGAEALERLLSLGYVPIRLRRGTRIPIDDAWQKYTAELARMNADAFDGCNVGILIGRNGGNLLDVDLETPDARAVARFLLPEGGAWCGRDGNGHCLYACPDLPETGSKVEFPGVELRWGTQQTAIFGSLDADVKRGKPACELSPPAAWPSTVPFTEVLEAVRDVSIAASVLPHWTGGSRHALTLPLAGALLPRAGLDRTMRIIRAICLATGDPEAEDRLRAVHDTASRLAQGDRATGLTTLRDAAPSLANALLRIFPPTSSGALPEVLVVSGEDLLTRLEEDLVEYDPHNPPSTSRPEGLVDGLFYPGAVHLLNATSGAGKTTLMLQLSLSVVSGAPFLGLKTRPSNVLYLNYELPDWRVYEVLGILRNLVPASGGTCLRLDFLHHPPLFFGLDGKAHEALARLSNLRGGYGLIVIDTLSASFEIKDENDNAQAAKHISLLRQLAADTGAAIVVLHHIGDRTDYGSPAYRGRGATAWGANSNAVINLISKGDDLTYTLEVGKHHCARQGKFIIHRAALGEGFTSEFEGEKLLRDVLPQDAVKVAELLANTDGAVSIADIDRALDSNDPKHRKAFEAVDALVKAHKMLDLLVERFQGAHRRTLFRARPLTLTITGENFTHTATTTILDVLNWTT